MPNVAHVTIRADFDDDATRDAERSFRAIRKEMGGVEREAREMATTTKRAGGEMALLKGTVVGLFGVETVRRAGAFALELASAANQAEVMRRSFLEMAANRTSNPAEMMLRLDEATRGTLSNIDQLAVANMALSSGIEPLYSNLHEIVADTMAVSTALGRSAEQDIERVVAAIVKQEQELLDELGIVARAEQAYERYAQQLGVSAGALSDLEKRSAFAQLVMDELATKADAVGDPINRQAEAVARLGAEWENLKVNLGEGGLLETLAGPKGVGAIEGVLAAINEEFEIERRTAAEGKLQADLAAGRRLPEGANIDITNRLGFGLFGGGGADIDIVGSTRPRTAANTAIGLDGVDPNLTAATDLTERWAAGLGILGNEIEFQDMMARKRASLSTTEVQRETALLRIDQEAEVVRARRLGASADEIAQLIDMQTAEEDLVAQRHLQLQALEEQRERQQAEAMARREMSRAMQAGIAILTQFNVQAGAVAGVFAALVDRDPFAAAVSGVGLLGQHLGFFDDQVAETDRLVTQAVTNMQSVLASLEDTVLGLEGAGSDELRQLQRVVAQPLIDLFQQMEAASPDEFIVDLRNFVEQLGAVDRGFARAGGLADAVERLDDGGALRGDKASGYYTAQDILRALGIENPSTFVRDALVAFGDDVSFAELGRDMFAITGEMEAMATAAGKLAGGLDPARLALEATFEAQEMALRQRASAAFAAAGADPVAQREVFIALEREIEAMRRSRQTALRATPSVILPGAAARPAGGSEGGGDSTGSVVDVAGTTTADIAWPAAVNMVRDDAARHVPGTWGWLVDIPEDLSRYERDWWQALSMRSPWGATNRRHRPNTWGWLVDIPADLDPYQRDWWQTLEMRSPWGGTNRRHQPNTWGWLVDIPADLDPYRRSWDSSVEMFYDRDGRPVPYHWLQLAELPDDLRRYRRSWASAVEMYYSASGRHRPTWWGDFVDFSGTRPVEIDISRVVRLTGRLHLDVSAHLDQRQLEDQVQAAINRLTRDRKVDYSSGGSGGF